MKVLAVIPARGGSKAIKRKNLRLLKGRPLIDYAIKLALLTPAISDVVVTTDDDRIAEYVGTHYDVYIRRRPLRLAEDDVPLDPVVEDAVDFVEQFKSEMFDIVLTIQPTSPTLKVPTLARALNDFIEKQDADSYVSVVDDTHLRWGYQDGEIIPLYSERVNRQWLPKTYRETGAFVISKRSVISQSDRLGPHPKVWPVPSEEAIDIDNALDWLIAETILSRLDLLFVVLGNRFAGLGHVYRSLTLADTFLGHNVQFVALNSSPQTTELIAQSGYEHRTAESLKEVCRIVSALQPDIVINDILDTEEWYVKSLRSMGTFVVNFEDLGEGSLQADLVFNALYELSSPPPNHRFGAKYVCLREDFLLYPPAPFRDPPSTLLVTFGGVDENNLTVKVCHILPELINGGGLKRVLMVLGPAYLHEKELESCLNSLEEAIRSKVQIYKSVDNMAKLMREADVAITSNGRTVYELAAMGVPGVTISQNDRETLHLFSRYSGGFRYLGLGNSLSEDAIVKAVLSIVKDISERKKMREALENVDLRGGLERVKREILDAYWRWKDERNNHREAKISEREDQ